MNIVLALAFIALVLILPLVVMWLAVPVSRECPFCGGETLAVRAPLARLLGRWLVLRWCMRCDWQGLARALPPKSGSWRFETVRQRANEKRSSTSGGP